MLQQKGIAVSEISGYQYEVGGHLAVAGAVAAGVAHVGIGIEAAAEASGLAFVPLEEERYDLVIPNHLMDEAGVQVLLNLLRRPEFRRRVESLGGYDVSQMGDTVPAP
jgi:putative molybdopterin biosynthesis protein